MSEGFRERSPYSGFAKAEIEDMAGGALAESDGLSKRDAMSLGSSA